MPSSEGDNLSMASDLPFLGPRHSMELQELTRKPKRSTSQTLGELLQRVGDSTTTDLYPHHLLDVQEPFSQPASMPFVLSFHNLTYSVKARQKILPACFTRSHNNHTSTNASLSSAASKSRMKVLLNDISGQAREGEIMAVLGASGSGKSTLIDALADRISRESLKGTITLNGDVLESKLLKVISAYVMQDDLLFPMLTVEETLMFSAEFRLPRTMSKSRKRARVQALIDQLGLRSAAKTIIGDEGHRGVSGGERRRVSIGTDIIHDPIVLFLDEPTSGLDSTSAYMVVKVLQRIAQSGSIVIMSIHQPSYRILSLLDSLIILSRGQTVFSGSPAILPQFFADFGNPIPANEDKTEFALDYIRELEGTMGTKSLVDFNKKWQMLKNPRMSFSNGPKMSLKDAISASISMGKLVSGATNIDPSSNLSNSVPKYANPFWKEMIVIASRSITNSRRAPELFGARFGAVVITGIILATMFYKLDNSPKGVQERLGFFAFAMSTTFYTCAEAIPVFLMDRYIFMRETAYNAYRRSSYVLSHAIISIPSLLILSISFSVTTYWAVGLDGGTSGFLIYFIFVLASFWAGSSFVTFLSGIIFNLMMAYNIVIAILAYFVLFSGLFITRDRIPNYWIWFHYASLVKYPYQGVMQNEFDDPTKCFVRGIQVFDGSPLRDVPDSVKLNMLKSMSKTLGMNITRTTCLTTGSDILKQSGVTDIDMWHCLLITIALGFLFRVLFYFALLIGSKNKRSPRMPRNDDRYNATTRLYVGHLSSRTRSRDLEHIFNRYGRVRDVDMKRDYAFVEFSDPRDADDARYSLDGRDVDGRRITVEFAKGVPRGPGGVREYVGRGPAPGSGRCFNCGLDGHWARDCKAGDWKNKCYRCGERGHIERNCQNSPKKLSGHSRSRSYSRSPVRSRSPRRGRGRSRSFSKSPSYSRSRSPARRGRDVDYKERRSRSPVARSPEPKRGASPSKTRKRSPTPDKDSPREKSPSPRRERMETERDGYSDSPKETSRSPVSPTKGRSSDESPYAPIGRDRSPSPRDDRSPIDDEDNAVRSPRGSESP
ncbi:hypothetical protein BUALT_Bualt09G0067800 [Buddleja alternifolia]|uniref:Uncharacterized protein n=1 Tax=Buddleja alternifolia TaxID=168488 RepID=A0AAV6X287_9LAMI|nr:hypothetical protein BUALT_Bualt09G0067800 [Buddleja alternifolia]